MNDLAHAKEWIKFAERDYDVALFLNENYRPLPIENICYGCQQSVEKSLKAVLAYYKADIPKTHDIIMLKEQCRKYTDDINIDNKIAGTITRLAVKSRYPDDIYEFTDEHVKLGLKYAKQILDQAKQTLGISQETSETQER